MITQETLPRRRRRQASLLFAPLAWLKLLYFCHSGDTEVGGGSLIVAAVIGLLTGSWTVFILVLAIHRS